MSYIDKLTQLEIEISQIIDDPTRGLDNWRNQRIKELHNIKIQSLPQQEFKQDENLVMRHLHHYNQVILQVWSELDNKVASYQSQCDDIIITIRQLYGNNINQIELARCEYLNKILNTFSTNYQEYSKSYIDACCATLVSRCS